MSATLTAAINEIQLPANTRSIDKPKPVKGIRFEQHHVDFFKSHNVNASSLVRQLMDAYLEANGYEMPTD